MTSCDKNIFVEKKNVLVQINSDRVDGVNSIYIYITLDNKERKRQKSEKTKSKYEVINVFKDNHYRSLVYMIRPLGPSCNLILFVLHRKN